MRYIHTEDLAWNAIFIVIIGLVVYSFIYIRDRNNTIKVVDGCEYIRVYYRDGWNLIHKGNCTNIIHYKK
jgi:hypothetical protein